jgi:hypothetical protein
MSRINRSFVVIVILAAMFASLACSVGSILPAASTPTSVPPTVDEKIPTYAPPTAKPGTTTPGSGKATAVSGATPAAGIPQTENAQTGLDKLESYRMNYNMVIDGKDAAGKAAKQELKLIQEYIKSSNNMHMSIQGSGWATELGGNGLDFYQMDKTSYILTTAKDATKPTCMSFSSDKPTFDKSQLMSMDELMGAIQSKDLVARGETVNGVKADHYKLSKADLGFGVVTSQSGEVWVAQEGGYLVRFIGQADGDFSLSDDKIKGKVTWTYDLLQVNKLTAITLPAECKASSDALKDLPIPTNATEKNSVGDLITFTSPDAPKVVGEFYRKELIAKGWKILSDSNLDTVVMLSIQKDTRKFQIMITPGTNDKGTAVVITKAQ